MIGKAADSFFNGRRIFQIDGNLGAVAGITETLIQSHTGIIHLLPALPPAWQNGNVTGLAARGAVKADIRWENGRLTEAVLRPELDGSLEVRADGVSEILLDGQPVPTEQTPYGLLFHAQAGKEYILH